jgi:hypothetical protein
LEAANSSLYATKAALQIKEEELNMAHSEVTELQRFQEIQQV